MSAYSDAWHAMDPATREGYRSFALRYTYFCDPWDDANFPGFKGWFDAAYYFTSSTGIEIAMHNFYYQLIDTGSFDPNVVVIRDDQVGWVDPAPGPVYSFGEWPPWWDQFTDPEALCWNYPRPKYRIRKSYWTGRPRKRRNL